MVQSMSWVGGGRHVNTESTRVRTHAFEQKTRHQSHSSIISMIYRRNFQSRRPQKLQSTLLFPERPKKRKKKAVIHVHTPLTPHRAPTSHPVSTP
jgi:hypothetical protein